MSRRSFLLSDCGKVCNLAEAFSELYFLCPHERSEKSVSSLTWHETRALLPSLLPLFPFKLPEAKKGGADGSVYVVKVKAGP